VSQTSQSQPVIIIKKKVYHAGHHGGAWKVAYADFVTAMMAFFIVMWLMNSQCQDSQSHQCLLFRSFRQRSAHPAARRQERAKP